MSRAKADKKPSSEHAEVRKMGVLESTTEVAWAFQSWKDSVENEFKTKGLHGYLEGTIASVFEEPLPEFKLVIDMLVMEVDPDTHARTPRTPNASARTLRAPALPRSLHTPNP
jgi:hypothetical protein